VVGLQLVVAWLDGLGRPARKGARVDVGLVEGLEDHALREVRHGVGLLLLLLRCRPAARRLRGAVDVLKERLGPGPRRHPLGPAVALLLVPSRARVREGLGAVSEAKGGALRRERP